MIHEDQSVALHAPLDLLSDLESAPAPLSAQTSGSIYVCRQVQCPSSAGYLI